MNRYITNWYVATTLEEANRKAAIDHTPPEKIRVTENVEPVHVTGSWILWSDGKLTTSIGSGLPRGGKLSATAVQLISNSHGSDSGYVEDGVASLARIAEIISEDIISAGECRGRYAPEQIIRKVVRYDDGTTGELYIHTAGYFEGYMFDVYKSPVSLRA